MGGCDRGAGDRALWEVGRAPYWEGAGRGAHGVGQRGGPAKPVLYHLGNSKKK